MKVEMKVKVSPAKHVKYERAMFVVYFSEKQLIDNFISRKIDNFKIGLAIYSRVVRYIRLYNM